MRCRKRKHTPIHNLNVNAAVPSFHSQLQPAQRVGIRIRPRRRRIEQLMRNRAYQIRARTGDAAGSKRRVVVCQIAFVGAAMGGGKREVLMSDIIPVVLALEITLSSSQICSVRFGLLWTRRWNLPFPSRGQPHRESNNQSDQSQRTEDGNEYDSAFALRQRGPPLGPVLPPLRAWRRAWWRRRRMRRGPFRILLRVRGYGQRLAFRDVHEGGHMR